MDPTKPYTSSGGISHSRGGSDLCPLAGMDIGGSGGPPLAHCCVQWPPGEEQLPAQLWQARRSETPNAVNWCQGSDVPTKNCQLSTFNWQLGRGGPPWLAVRHREVDGAHLGPLESQAVGCTLPIRYQRARESIVRSGVRNTCNLPKVIGNAKRTLGRCKATRSFASDAGHEFPRIRSAGLFPMMSFRRSGFPQLLLMQPSLLRRREVCDTQTSKAFS
jgi:hypothetical protein